MQRLISLIAIIIYLPAFSQNIFQVTTAATAPGQTILVRGEGIDLVKKIEVGRLPDERVDNVMPVYVALPEADHLPDLKGGKVNAGEKVTVVDAVQQNDQSVKVIVPKGLQQGVYSVRLTNAKGGVSGFYVNVPMVNWVISEDGYNAGAGGDVLRIQGKNLFRSGGNAQVLLVNGNKVIRLKVDSVYDDYATRVILPKDIPIGQYQLYYHHGLGGRTAWSMPLTVKVVNKEMWKTQVYDVKKYGAKGDGVHDDTEAFKQASQDAMKGGIISVPAGQYILSGPVMVAPGVVLKGQGRQQTILTWNKMSMAPACLIRGVDHFGVMDLAIRTSQAVGIIDAPSGHVVLERLLVEQDPGNEVAEKWNKTGIIVKGPQIIIRDCVFKISGMYMFDKVSGFMQRCRFEKTGKSEKPYMLVHPKGLIFEDCFKQVNGYGYGATIDESYDLYEARNVIPFNYINDREVMTFDGGSGGYYGKVGAINGQLITLAKNGQTFQWRADKWIGGGVFIIDGKGTGQYRRIVKQTLDQVQVDEPFLVPPDTSSVISITTIRDRLYFVNNTVSDGGAFQFYGSAQHCLVAGLKIKRSAGIVGRGSYVNYGRQPNWYVDILNCELSDGTYTPQTGQKDKFRGDQQINVIGSGGTGLNIGTLVRGNVLSGKSYIRVSPGGEINDVQDAIIEGNKVSGAANGLAIYGVGRVINNLFIHDNQLGTVDIHKALKTEGYQIKQ
jgi:hypothetical protein